MKPTADLHNCMPTTIKIKRMNIWWRDDGGGDRTVVVAPTKMHACKLLGQGYNTFSREYRLSTNSHDQWRAQQVGAGVWVLRSGEWTKTK